MEGSKEEINFMNILNIPQLFSKKIKNLNLWFYRLAKKEKTLNKLLTDRNKGNDLIAV